MQGKNGREKMEELLIFPPVKDEKYIKKEQKGKKKGVKIDKNTKY